MTLLSNSFRQLIERAVQGGKGHSKFERSKPLNFYLSYKSEPEELLEPLIQQIADSVEDHERKTGKRKNKRSAAAEEGFRNAVRTLVLNAVQVCDLIGDNLHLAISLNKNDYGLNKRYRPPSIAYDQFKAAYTGLEAIGYILTVHKGFRDPHEGGGLRTRIKGTEALVNLFAGKNFKFVRRSPVGPYSDETIILRDEGRLVKYEDTGFTKKARENLAIVNDTIARHTYGLNITNDETRQMKAKLESSEEDERQPFIDFTAIRLYRIFSDNSFKKGGRFYRGWWQNVPKDYRPHITIDGRPTIELDYKTFHPSILYAEAGLQLTDDPYIIPGIKVHRIYGKIAFNALLSAKGTPNMPPGFPDELPDEDGDFIPNISWKDFLKLMKAKHQSLVEQDMFLHGYGLEVQFKDAKLAEKILLHFSNENIPCLPIHDSFIVSEDKASELEAVMKGEYEAMFGYKIGVRGKS